MPKPKRQPTKAEREAAIAAALEFAESAKLFDRPPDAKELEPLVVSEDQEELQKLLMPRRASWMRNPRSRA